MGQSAQAKRISSAMDDNREITADSKTLGFGDGESSRPCGCITRKQKQINKGFFSLWLKICSWLCKCSIYCRRKHDVCYNLMVIKFCLYFSKEFFKNHFRKS